jgi:hypothetical protein
MILINNSHIFQNTSLLPVKSINWTNEHLPNGVDIDYIKNINHNIDFLTSLRCDITYEAIEWTAQERTFLIDSVGSSEVRIRHFYFPGWKAYINGKEISVEKDKFTKGMIVTLPEGKSTFKIIFVDTPIRKFSKYIFVLFILLFSAFYFWNLKNHRLQSKIYY